MTETAARPSLRKRLLGTNLRVTRERLGRHLEDAAAVLDCNDSKISRIETGRSGIKSLELKALLTYYGITDPDEQRPWLALAKIRRAQRGAQVLEDPLTDQLAQDFLDLMGMEREVAACQTFQPGIVPGLLQTDAYARAVVQAGRPGPLSEGRQALHAARMQRQRVLTRTDPEPMSLWVVLGEAALRQQWGGPSVLADQLRKLIELGQTPQVTMQVLPFSAESHPGGALPFSLYAFPEAPEMPIVTVESHTSHAYLEDTRDTLYYRNIFDEIRGIALSPLKSEALIAKIAAEHSNA
ncbi:helix-turn-helix domain-containing protein [Yinghuangia aomiensis]